jgi:plastocyanin
MGDGFEVHAGRSQLRLGVIAGVIAYVAGFVVFTLPGPIANASAYTPENVVNYSITESDFPPGAAPALSQEFPLSETVDSFSSAGGLFYNAHLVDVIISGGPTTPTFRSNILLAEATNASTGFEAVPNSEANIELVGLPIPPAVLFAVPVFLLAVGGYLINERSEAVPTPETAVASGGAIGLGYLPLVSLGAAMIRFRSPEVLFGDIDLVGAILIAGVVYPAVFGGLGGYGWFLTRGSDDRDTETTAESGETTHTAGERPPADTDTPVATGSDETGPPPSVERVVMTDTLAFEPETVTITPGDAVRWDNEAGLTFTVTAYEKQLPDDAEHFASGGFDSEQAARDAYPEGGIGSGESYRHVFETPGSYEYFCVPQENAGMTGTVEVRER